MLGSIGWYSVFTKKGKSHMYLLDKIGISKRTFTDEGYLIVEDARIARTGVQEYLAFELGLTDRDPLEVVKIYRPESEVFADVSMQSFSNKPVTNNHPQELVNPKNAKDLSVGHSGDSVTRDGDFLITKLIITDEEAIKDIQSGKKQLSNGYTSELKFEAGQTNDGEEFHAIQTNIKGNHIAIVKQARCGADCKISDNKVTDKLKPTEGEQTMLLLIDGIEFEFSDKAAAQAVQKVLADNEKLQGVIVDKDAEIQTLKDSQATELADLETKHKKEVDTLQAKVDDAEANKLTPELLDAKVAMRTEVISVAGKVIENFDAKGKDCHTIRTEVINAKFKDLDLEGKSVDYINARYDAIAEEVKEGKSDTLTDAMRLHAQGEKTETKVVDSEEHRQKMIERNKNAWQKKSAQA